MQGSTCYENFITQNNISYNAGAGIYVQYSSNNVITENTFMNNNGGLSLTSTYRNTLIDNSFYNSQGIGLMGYLEHVNNHIIQDNYIEGRPILYYKNEKYGEVISSNFSQLILANCSNFLIKDNILDKNGGIFLCYSIKNTIINNRITNATKNGGITLFGWCDNNRIENNHISYCSSGILLYGFCENNIIKNNQISYIHSQEYKPYASGIVSGGSSNNQLIDNYVLNCAGYGILLGDRSDQITNNSIINNRLGGIAGYGYVSDIGYLSDSVIEKNNIINNGGYGIYIGDKWSNNNQILNNIIKDNKGYGILIDGTYNTIIKHNNFSDNGLNIEGSFVDHWSTHNIDDNIVNGNPLLYHANDNHLIITKNYGQIILANCTDMTIQLQNITKTDIGIQLGFSHHNLIDSNSCSDNNIDGMYLQASSNNIITNNNINNNFQNGIHIDGGEWYPTDPYSSSNYNNIHSNNLRFNGLNGIFIDGRWDSPCEYNEITRNNISNDGFDPMTPF